MSSASFYKWRAKFGGMDASLTAEMKDMAEQNWRLKKMHAEMSMQNSLLKEAAWKKALRLSHRREMATNAVIQRGASLYTPWSEAGVLSHLAKGWGEGAFNGGFKSLFYNNGLGSLAIKIVLVSLLVAVF